MAKIGKSYKNTLVVFLSGWFTVVLLYLLSFSGRLYYEIPDFLPVAYFLIVFLFGWFFSKLFWRNDAGIEFDTLSVLANSWSRMRLLWYFLILLSVIEVFYSKYIPIVSMALGAKVSHFDFGVPSLHGFVLAGYLFFSVIFSINYVSTKDKKYLYLFLLIIVYAVLVMSRKLMMVAFFQFAAVLFLMTRVTFKKILVILFVAFLVLLFFGFLGGVRNGHDVLSDYGAFNSDVFIQLPGLGWGYLYITTPVHNLLYTMNNIIPEGNIAMTNTFDALIPSALSEFLGIEDIDNSNRFLDAGEKRYWLESKAFNVSTSFIEPYIDLGFTGITIFSALIGFLSGIVNGRLKGVNWLVVNVIFMAAAGLSIYSNNYTNLNFIGQFLWLYFSNFFLRLRLKY